MKTESITGDPMLRVRYKTTQCDSDNLIDTIDDYGRNGWELHSMLVHHHEPITPSTYKNIYLLVFFQKNHT